MLLSFLLLIPTLGIIFILFRYTLGIHLYSIFYKVFTWKNLVRITFTAISGIFIRAVLYHFFNVDIFLWFIQNLSLLNSYIGLFWYFVANSLVGLIAGELFNYVLIHFIKEQTKEFLALNLGIEWPSKMPFYGPQAKEFTSNIKVIEPSHPGGNENTIVRSSRGSISSISSSESSHRSLSPFSRPATPVLRPATPTLIPELGQRDFNPAVNPNNVANTPLSVEGITNPDYFRGNNDHTDVFKALDTVINNLIKAKFNMGNVIGQLPVAMTRGSGVAAFPFIYTGLIDDGRPNNPFHTWGLIRKTNDCSTILLRCLIARVEFSKASSENLNLICYGVAGNATRGEIYNSLLEDLNTTLSSRSGTA